MKPLTVTLASPLLAYLLVHLKDRTRTKIKQLLQHGSIEVNGRTVTAFDHPLSPGDTVRVLAKSSSVRLGVQRQLPFSIIHEDASILVIDKPAGLLSMGTETDKTHTAYFAATSYMQRSSKGGRGRIFIVHRLDRDTSGLLVFAKTPEAKEFLQEKWEDARKKYYAVVEGVPDPPRGAVRTRLAEDSFRRVYSTSPDDPDGKDAVTHYNLLKSDGGYSLLEVALETGRKNQIRVHLSDIGVPVVGDDKYDAQTDPMGRLGLHAFSLTIPHPDTGRPVSFKSPLPAEFEAMFRSHRAGRR